MTATKSFPIRVYYEDTDSGGIVYYGNYFKFAERGRTEFLRDIGITNSGLMDDMNIGIVVRHVAADFLSAAKLDDQLNVETTIEEVKNASMIMNQRIMKDGHPLVTMVVKLACIDVTSGKSVRLPQILTDKIKQ